MIDDDRKVCTNYRVITMCLHTFVYLLLPKRNELMNVVSKKDTVGNEAYMRSETNLFSVKSYFQIGWSYNHIHHCV